jgi:hypothetical protein
MIKESKHQHGALLAELIERVRRPIWTMFVLILLIIAGGLRVSSVLADPPACTSPGTPQGAQECDQFAPVCATSRCNANGFCEFEPKGAPDCPCYEDQEGDQGQYSILSKCTTSGKGKCKIVANDKTAWECKPRDCPAGATTCASSGNATQVCDDIQGFWRDPVSCSSPDRPICQGGSCVACNDGAQRCSLDATSAQKCVNGQWQTQVCASGSCKDGLCTECAIEGAKECSLDSTGVRECRNGHWVPTQSCAPDTCSNAQCICTQNGLACASGTARSVCENGNRVAEACGPNENCVNNNCQCINGSKMCSLDSKSVLECVNGQWQTRVCASGDTCSNGECKCTQDGTACASTKSRSVCSNGTRVAVACPSNQVCENNVCQRQQCPAGQQTCWDWRCCDGTCCGQRGCCPPDMVCCGTFCADNSNQCGGSPR